MGGRIQIRGRYLDGGNVIPVAIMGSLNEANEGVPLLIDEEITSIVVTDHVHYMVHAGRMFIAGISDATLADATEFVLHLDPETLEAHMVFSAACGGDFTIELLENPTVSGGGALTPVNKNRNSARTSDVNTLDDPTVTVDGTVLLQPILFPGGSGGNAQGGAITPRVNSEWELNPGRTYAIRLTNVSGQARIASIVAEWYEED